MEDISVLMSISLLVFLFFAWRWSKNNSKPLPPSPPGVPILGHLYLFANLPHHNLHKVARIYGPIMHIRLGVVPVVVVSTGVGAEILLKNYDASVASRPQSQVSIFLSYGSKGIISSQYGPYWRKIRKLCSIHLLSSSMIDSFEPMRRKELGHLIMRLRGTADQVVDISSEVGRAIEEISYRMIFGLRKINDRFKPSIRESAILSTAPNLADYIPFIGMFDLQGFTRRWKAISKVLDDFLEKIIDEHDQENIEEQERLGGFVHVLLSLRSPSAGEEEKLDKTSIKAITVELLGAAMDTSAAAIEWALSEILRHPEVKKKVQEELENVIGLDRLVEEAHLGELDYLCMVVKESMRLHPVTALFFRQSVEGVSINGYHIPEKTWIITNNWAIGRDPIAWPEKTLEFFPERFINSNLDVRGHDMHLIPFGLGRRKCLGMEVGIRTVQLVLAQLLHCFNWELPHGVSPKDVDMHESFGMSVTRANPLLAVPTYRLHLNKVLF